MWGRTANLRQRIDGLSWAQWLAAAAPGAAAFGWWAGRLSVWVPAMAVLAGFMLCVALRAWQCSLRRQFIREAALPPFLRGKLREAFPHLSERDADLVLRGLRQFFMTHLRSGRRFVAMPSRAVDEAWHAHILHTEAYQRWCRAAFGRLLHHTPAEVLSRDARRNDGLRRTWYWACKEESIDPRRPIRLPLLFALDAKFAIAGGFHYVPDCSAIDRASGSDVYCGSSFGAERDGSWGGPFDDDRRAGDSQGFGGSETSSSAESSDSGDAGSSCGGGCGGGGGGGGSD